MGSLMILVIKFLWVIAIFWHTLAFAAGGMNVVGAYRALFSGAHDPARTRAIRSAEWQLWAFFQHFRHAEWNGVFRDVIR